MERRRNEETFTITIGRGFSMKAHKTPLAVLGTLALVLAGCSSTADGGPGASNGGGGTGGGTGTSGANTSGGSADSCKASFSATTDHNYQFSSTITLTPVLVKPDSELTFDWSAVNKDFLGHAMDPAKDIDSANLVLWALNEQDLQTKLNADALRQLDAVVPATSPTKNTATSVSLFDFQSAAGEPLTQDMILPYMSATKYPPAANTYTFIVASGSLISGGKSRMIQALKLDPASTNTQIKLSNTSTKLDYTVDFHSLKPTMVPGADPKLTVDWADILTNAMGNTFLPTQITEVRVAHYTQPQAELEAHFLDLELIDEDTWRDQEIAGTSIELSKLTNDAGQSFPGVSASGTWVLGLVCGACRNPAPWYLTILKPCQ
jgi:hypothetical protein